MKHYKTDNLRSKKIFKEVDKSIYTDFYIFPL